MSNSAALESSVEQPPETGDAVAARPFVDFYRELDISPVKQDIRNIERHFERREALYRFLGISPLAVRGAKVIEFGPGSGYNALHTASLNPSSYVLVDANPRGIAEMRHLFTEHGILDRMTIAEALIEEYPILPEFDVVLAEGLIVFQNDPVAFAQRIGAFAKPGGIFVVTCSDAVSILSEIGRRLIGLRIASPSLSVEHRLAILRPVFSSHLATLSGMSRSVDDWLLDNLIQPIGHGKLFSIGDAISGLRSAFDVYGSSPRFLTDWRWYKDVCGEQRRFDTIAQQSYEKSIINMLDYRFTHQPHAAQLGQLLLTRSNAIYEALRIAEKTGQIVPEVLENLREITNAVDAIAPGTARSIDSLRRFLAQPDNDFSLLDDFIPFFGRGMQYVSFIRKTEIAASLRSPY